MTTQKLQKALGSYDAEYASNHRRDATPATPPSDPDGLLPWQRAVCDSLRISAEEYRRLTSPLPPAASPAPAVAPDALTAEERAT